jgi:hypothetical protein
MSDPLAKWGFKEEVWIQRTDAGGYAITVAGVDVIGQSGLIYAKNLMPRVVLLRKIRVTNKVL